MSFKSLSRIWLFPAVGVLIASHIFKGIHYNDIGALIVAVLLMSFCNMFLKPLLMFLALPFIVLTFGFGIWLINALLFMGVGFIVDGFYVDRFGSAMAGALVVSLTGPVADLFSGASTMQSSVHIGRMRDSVSGQNRRNSLKDDEVIDI